MLLKLSQILSFVGRAALHGMEEEEVLQLAEQGIEQGWDCANVTLSCILTTHSTFGRFLIKQNKSHFCVITGIQIVACGGSPSSR